MAQGLSGQQVFGDCFDPCISGDGKKVAFYSTAANLVSGDTNGVADVFVCDLATGITVRVSKSSGGAQGNSASTVCALNGDGSKVVFRSLANNLVAGDGNSQYDIFLHDLASGETTRVSVDSAGIQGDLNSDAPRISADGSLVAFQSDATNLVFGDTNGVPDIFVRNLVTGITSRVSVSSDGSQGDNGSYTPAISADGSMVAFQSIATNLIIDDTNGASDIFVCDLKSGATTRVSMRSSGIQINGSSSAAGLSGDGTKVTFQSSAKYIDPSDNNGYSDVFASDVMPASFRLLRINDEAVSEGDSGMTDVNFTITLSSSSVAAITVNYATADGTARAGSDYVARSGIITFAPGETVKTISVPIVGDAFDEENESFEIRLTLPVNGTLADGTCEGTIVNDDAPPAISIDDAGMAEGNGNGSLTFHVSFSALSGKIVTVNYATADGTARAGSDYVARSGIITFAPGETVKTIRVPIIGDALDEENESFEIRLSAPVNGTLMDGTGTGTIVNDDSPPSISIDDDAAVTEGNNDTNLVFTVSLSAPSGRTVTVDYGTADGSATAASDYTATSGTLTFAPGETEKTISVPVLGDTLDEDDESFTVTLSAADGAAIGDGEATGTIQDDDEAPSLSVDDVAVTEGNNDTNLVFTVSLFAPSGRTVTVDYGTADGSATAGSDYTATSGTLTFAPGETEKSISVPVLGDTLDEDDESFTVTLSAADGAAIRDGEATGTIQDDDEAPSLSVDDVAVTEGNNDTNLVFTVSLSAPSGRTVTVDYGTADGSATAGSDYTVTSGTLTFAPGETEKSISVPVLGDALDEDNEIFEVRLTNSTNAAIGDAQGIGTITDDDDAPVLSILNAEVAEGDSGTKTMSFALTLSAPSGRTISLHYATDADTATAGSDFVAQSGNITFNPGETAKSIDVIINGDTANERDERLNVNLTSPVNVKLARTGAKGIIVNDDPLPGLSVNDVSLAEGNSGSKLMTFTVTLSAASARSVTFNYATDDGTATAANNDYVAKTNGVLTIGVGQTSKTFTVTIRGDTINENDEKFNVVLSAPVNARIERARGTGTITNDDPLPTVSIGDASITEGDSGTKNLTFALTLSAASARSVSVNYATNNGTALAGSDYIARSGAVTIGAGQISKTFTITIKGDTVNEGNEAFFVNLSSPVNAAIADGQGVGTIADDDASG